MGTRWVLLSSAAILQCVAGTSFAQTPQQKKEIAASLDTQRVTPIAGTVIDAENSGYFRVQIGQQGLTRANLCPASKAERDALAQMSASLFNWALRKKKNWGAAAQLVYDGRPADFDNPEFRPNVEVKFFSVLQPGGDVQDCNPAAVNFAEFHSPLIPVDQSGAIQRIDLQFTTWFNDQSDQARIEKIPRIAGGLLGLFGLPIGLLDMVAGGLGTTASAELKAAVDLDKSSAYRTALYPARAANIGATAYLGLREPKAETQASDARALATLTPVSSLFSQASGTYVSLAAKTVDDILDFKIPVPVATAPAGWIYLQNLVSNNADYQGMLAAGDYAVLSNRCDTFDRYLRDTLKFSRVDSALVLHAIVRQRAASNPAVHDMTKIACLTRLAPLLAKVSIAVTAPPLPVEPPKPPATRIRMDDAMTTLASFRYLPAEALGESNWATLGRTVAFPLLVVDPQNRFGWDNQQRRFAAEDHALFHAFWAQNFANIGCWAYFDEPPLAFALGMGDGVGLGGAATVRKSASLARLAGGDVVTLQYRYAPGGATALIDAIAIVTADAAARDKMLGNTSCTAGDPAREWMQSYLRPPAPPARR